MNTRCARQANVLPSRGAVTGNATVRRIAVAALMTASVTRDRCATTTRVVHRRRARTWARNAANGMTDAGNRSIAGGAVNTRCARQANVLPSHGAVTASVTVRRIAAPVPVTASVTRDRCVTTTRVVHLRRVRTWARNAANGMTDAGNRSIAVSVIYICHASMANVSRNRGAVTANATRRLKTAVTALLIVVAPAGLNV